MNGVRSFRPAALVFLLVAAGNVASFITHDFEPNLYLLAALLVIGGYTGGDLFDRLAPNGKAKTNGG